jgi:hypothetical protein
LAHGSADRGYPFFWILDDDISARALVIFGLGTFDKCLVVATDHHLLDGIGYYRFHYEDY